MTCQKLMIWHSICIPRHGHLRKCEFSRDFKGCRAVVCRSGWSPHHRVGGYTDGSIPRRANESRKSVLDRHPLRAGSPMTKWFSIIVATVVSAFLSDPTWAGLMYSSGGDPNSSSPGASASVTQVTTVASPSVFAPRELPVDLTGTASVSIATDSFPVNSSLPITGHATSVMAIQGHIVGHSPNASAGTGNNGLGTAGRAGLSGLGIGGNGIGTSQFATNLAASPTASLTASQFTAGSGNVPLSVGSGSTGPVISTTLTTTVNPVSDCSPSTNAYGLSSVATGTNRAEDVLSNLITLHPDVPGLPIALENVSKSDPVFFLGAPEPHTCLIFACGLAGILVYRRRSATDD